MKTSMQIQLAKLAEMSTGELAQRYVELFGEPTRTRHKAYLIRKIAWRMQALAEGDLSERAKRRAEELANDADVRLAPPKPKDEQPAGAAKLFVGSPSDPRLPAPGGAIVRKYKGKVMKAFGFRTARCLWRALNRITSACLTRITDWQLRCRLGSGSRSAAELRPSSPDTAG